MNMLRLCCVFVAVLISNNTVHSQISQSILVVQQLGTDFIPANPIELIVTFTGVLSFISCYHRCHSNTKCRTVVSDSAWPSICCLYGGSVDTGTIIV
jgi:triosephosphate isomerase